MSQENKPQEEEIQVSPFEEPLDLGDMTMRLPITEHVNKLEDLLRGLLDQLETSKKEIQVVRGELQSLNYLNNQANNELSNDIAKETIRISKEFLELAGLNNNEHKEMNSTLICINEKKTGLQEEAILLESRIEETEGSVGYKEYIENLVSTYPIE